MTPSIAQVGSRVRFSHESGCGGRSGPLGVEGLAEPRIVANSIVAGSKFSIVYARNMLYGILEEVHRAVPLVRVHQRVDDLAQ